MSRIDDPAQLTYLIKQNSYILIAGTDEAGRGALAGPIVAAAIILNPESPISGVKDSKKLTPKRREQLYDLIVEQSICYAPGIVSAAKIDQIGIQAANILAMEIAISGLSPRPDCVLADWYENDSFHLPWHGVRDGEAAHQAIAAASIFAKVTRDRIMVELAAQYPEYGFDGHKGYGSEKHMAAIRAHGPSLIHRLSFEPCRTKL